MRAAYDVHRVACIFHLYKASRAFSFWTLQPYNGLYNTFQLSSPDNFDRLDYNTLTAAKDSFIEDQFREIEAESLNGLVPWPPPENHGNASGTIVEFTRATYPELFQSLERSRKAQITLDPARKSDEVHPFATWCNVRITKARVWMVGMWTK